MTELNRRELLRMGLAAGAPLPAAPRPNIVLFYADDLDADEIGCLSSSPNYPHPTGALRRGYGGTRGYTDPRMLTPNIDSLARGGAEFTRFYVTSPVLVRCTNGLAFNRLYAQLPLDYSGYDNSGAGPAASKARNRCAHPDPAGRLEISMAKSPSPES